MKKIIKAIFGFLNGLIRKNFIWKLFSVVLSVACWFVIMNIINPTEEKVYSVNLTLANASKLTESSLVVLNQEELEKTRVDIRVKAARSDLDTLDKKDNREKITATVDLNQFAVKYPEDISEPVYVSVTPNLMQAQSTYQIVSYTPQYVGINLDNYITKTVGITIEASGSAANGYLSTDPTAEPSQIEISGAKSVIETISKVSVAFDYSNASSDLQMNLIPIAYDAEGEKVEDISFNTSEVTVSCNISRKGIINIELPEITGEPAEGYMVSNVEYSPQIIDVAGDNTNLKTIQMDEFDISGISSSRTYKYDISGYLSSYGLMPKNSEDTIINVTVTIEPTTEKEITLDTGKVTLSGKNTEMFDYEISQSKSLKIQGLEKDINNIDASDITAVCDVSSLSEGTHSVAADIKTAQEQNIKISQIPEFTVKITSKYTAETETQTTTAAAEEDEEADETKAADEEAEESQTEG